MPGRQAAAHDWLIVPGERIGPVTRATSEAELLARFGPDAVVRREVYLAEGVCTDGALLYPGSADQMDIAWADSARSRPAFLRVSNTGARWTTDSGIRPGATLHALEAIRGEPITFSGFGWDYGGGFNWDLPGSAYRMSLRLQPDSLSWEILVSDPRGDEILGDRPVRSDHPLVRRLNISALRIALGFAPQFEEHDCLPAT